MKGRSAKLQSPSFAKGAKDGAPSGLWATEATKNPPAQAQTGPRALKEKRQSRILGSFFVGHGLGGTYFGEFLLGGALIGAVNRGSLGEGLLGF
jgi:hypothetical protein